MEGKNGVRIPLHYVRYRIGVSELFGYFLDKNNTLANLTIQDLSIIWRLIHKIMYPKGPDYRHCSFFPIYYGLIPIMKHLFGFSLHRYASTIKRQPQPNKASRFARIGTKFLFGLRGSRRPVVNKAIPN